MWCPSCSQAWYSAWATAGGGQAWASAACGWTSAGAEGGTSWATASGERASAGASGDQAWAWASSGETPEAAVGTTASSQMEDVYPRPPYSHGRLRVEATLSMGKYEIEGLGAVKDAFASAIIVARRGGRFDFFSDRIHNG